MTQPVSPLDDYPYHQIAESLAHVGSSDRNFYDRYYFNAHPLGAAADESMFVVFGLGQYPNLGVCDGFAFLRTPTEQRAVRASRSLGSDRSDLSVGPLRVEVLEPLQRLRVVCQPDDARSLSLDLTWTGDAPCVMEPRHFDRQFGRVWFDTMRFAQTGRWSGTITGPAGTVIAEPGSWGGSRDRSWGIRPVGEPEPAGIRATDADAGFFWLYCPLGFDDHTVVIIAQERRDGVRVIEDAVRVWADPARGVDLLGRPEHDLTFRPGSRDVLAATWRCGDGTVIEIEPLLATHIGVGTGYGFDGDGWRHGAWQGDLVVEEVVYDLTTEAGRAAMWGIVEHTCRATVTAGPTAGAVGHGMFECLLFGPNDRYGFTEFLDGFSPAP